MIFILFYFVFKFECFENDEDLLFNEIKNGVYFLYDNIDFFNDDLSFEILEYDISISEKVCYKNVKKYINFIRCFIFFCLLLFGILK